MECVQCTACIDACDEVMAKIGRPPGLIRYASLNSIERGERFRFTVRMGVYLGLLAALGGVLAALVFTRSEIHPTLLRAPGALFQATADGRIENLYTLKLINKTSRDIPVEVRLESPAGRIRVMGAAELVVPREKLVQTSVLVELEPSAIRGATTPLEVGFYSGGRRLARSKTVFVGPRPSPTTQKP